MKTKTDLAKVERVKKEVSRIKKLLNDLPKQTLDINMGLIDRAAFMKVALEDLERVMGDKGDDAYISTYQNGENQWGTKVSPEIQTYNSTMKNFMAAMKQLTDLLPEGSKLPLDDDGFEAFVNNR